MQKRIIIVENMNCENCVSRIKNVLDSILETYEISLANKTICFEGSSDTRAIIVANLESIGYKVI